MQIGIALLVLFQPLASRESEIHLEMQELYLYLHRQGPGLISNGLIADKLDALSFAGWMMGFVRQNSWLARMAAGP